MFWQLLLLTGPSICVLVGPVPRFKVFSVNLSITAAYANALNTLAVVITIMFHSVFHARVMMPTGDVQMVIYAAR